MERLDIIERIHELEREIALLPPGGIAAKTVRGREYFYHRVTRNGKRTETYVQPERVDELRERIRRRKELEAELKELRMLVPSPESEEEKSGHRFSTYVQTGSELEELMDLVRKYKRRECYSALHDYVFGDAQPKVFVLCGLRRTGKTTLMHQVLLDMTPEQLDVAAFIQIKMGDSLCDVYEDLKSLKKHGCRYVFIDEATSMENFIGGAAVFSDIFASKGMKVVLSGTDSLSFVIASYEQLYDRCILQRTTFIPYREFESVLGVEGIGEYIRYGGTMVKGGVDYNKTVGGKGISEYVDAAIAKNIQHSLEHYQGGDHFCDLYELYEKRELTSAINRVVEDETHRFTKAVLTKTFKSHDLGSVAEELLTDVENPFNLAGNIDKASVTKHVKEMLDILDKEEQTVEIDKVHADEIKEYLTMLDVIEDVEEVRFPNIGRRQKITVISQPGLRHAQAEALVNGLLCDEKFNALSGEERERVLERVMGDIEGRMMEEIVRVETKMAATGKDVFKLGFTVGEFDMVVRDCDARTCDVFEVKRSDKIVAGQYRHLVDAEKCAMTEHSFGRITGKYVIYRGEAAESDGIRYLNVEEYLKSLGDADGGYGYLHGGRAAAVCEKTVVGPELREGVFSGDKPKGVIRNVVIRTKVVDGQERPFATARFVLGGKAVWGHFFVDGPGTEMKPVSVDEDGRKRADVSLSGMTDVYFGGLNDGGVPMRPEDMASAREAIVEFDERIAARHLPELSSVEIPGDDGRGWDD